MAIHAGASIKAVQKMLGHKSATLTLDRYGHLYDDELQGRGRPAGFTARGGRGFFRVCPKCAHEAASSALVTRL